MLLIINDLQKRFYISWAPQLFLHFYVYISDFQCFTSTFISFFTHLLMLLKYFTDKIRTTLDNNNVSNKQTNNTMKTYLRNIKSIWKIYKQNRFTGNVYSYILRYTFKYMQRSVV